MPDADLLMALKQAKGGKKMFFAYVPKGAEGKLIVSKKKIPPKEIAEAKKDIGGGTPVTGKCFGEDGAMVFQVAKAAPPALAAAIKKVARKETGLSIDPEFRLAGDADAEEEDTGAPAPAAAAPAPAAPPAAPPAADAEQEEAPALNLAPWQAARQKAINDLKALATKIAATKHGSAAGVLKEIQSIISRLPANPAPKDIDKLEDFVRNDDTITAAEEVPDAFHDLDIRDPLLKALEAMKQ